MKAIDRIEKFLEIFQHCRFVARSCFETRIIYDSYLDKITNRINKDLNLNLKQLLEIDILIKFIREIDDKTLSEIVSDRIKYKDEYNFKYINKDCILNAVSLDYLLYYYSSQIPLNTNHTYDLTKQYFSKIIFSLDIIRELYTSIFTRRKDIIVDYLEQINKDRLSIINKKIKNKYYDTVCYLELGKKFLFVYSLLESKIHVLLDKVIPSNKDRVTTQMLCDLANNKMNNSTSLDTVMEYCDDNGISLVDRITNFLKIYHSVNNDDYLNVLEIGKDIMETLYYYVNKANYEFNHTVSSNKLQEFLKLYKKLKNKHKNCIFYKDEYDRMVMRLSNKLNVKEKEIENIHTDFIKRNSSKLDTVIVIRIMTEKLHKIINKFIEFYNDRYATEDEKATGSLYVMEQLIKATHKEYKKEEKKKKELYDTELQIKKLLKRQTPYELFNDLIMLVSNDYRYIEHKICENPHSVTCKLDYLNSYNLTSNKTIVDDIAYTYVNVHGEKNDRPFIECVAECFTYNPNDTRSNDEKVRDTCEVFSKLCELIDDMYNNIEKDLFYTEPINETVITRKKGVKNEKEK